MVTDAQEILIADLSRHKNQSKIFCDTTRFRVLVTGRRWGKTTLAINELLKNAIMIEGSINWYVAPFYSQAKMIAWKMFIRLIPPQIIRKKNETELSIVLANGSEVYLKGADNEDSLRGVGLSFVVLDEYSSMRINVWEEIIRPMLTDTKGKALFIGTPRGKNHFWELFIKGQKEDDEFKSWRFPTIDNPFIETDEVSKAKQQMNERYFRQEYEASFEDFVGLIWPEFKQKIHLIEPYYIPTVFNRIGAIDPAISGTTACLKAAIDEIGNLIIYSEYYEQNKRTSEVSQVIKEDIKWLIDPASAANNLVREGKLYNLYDEYWENGISARPAENDVDSGINRVAEYFKQGKIKIFSTCKNLVYELERYHWSEEKETRTGVLIAKPYKKDEHLCDCLRYIVMSRPSAAVQPAPKIQRGSVAWEMQQEEAEAKDWRRVYN